MRVHWNVPLNSSLLALSLPRLADSPEAATFNLLTTQLNRILVLSLFRLVLFAGKHALNMQADTEVTFNREHTGEGDLSINRCFQNRPHALKTKKETSQEGVYSFERLENWCRTGNCQISGNGFKQNGVHFEV